MPDNAPWLDYQQPAAASAPSNPNAPWLDYQKPTAPGYIQNIKSAGENAAATIATSNTYDTVTGVVGAGERGLLKMVASPMSFMINGIIRGDANSYVNIKNSIENFIPPTPVSNAVGQVATAELSPVSNVMSWITNHIATAVTSDPEKQQAIADAAGNVILPAVMGKLGGTKTNEPLWKPSRLPPEDAAEVAGMNQHFDSMSPEDIDNLNKDFSQTMRSQTREPAAEGDPEAILKHIGMDNVRKSVVDGNDVEKAREYNTSKQDSDAGRILSNQIKDEQNALKSFSGQLVEDAGGSVGDNQTASYNRGGTIVKPIEQLSDYYDAKIKDAYKTGDASAVQTPFTSDELNKLVSKDSTFLGTVEAKQLQRGLKARMQDLGITDDEGNPQISTVKAAENLRQYLAQQFTPATGRLLDDVRGAIDADVAKTGDTIYAPARALRKERADVLDDPKGIGRLAPGEDRQGLNRSVPVDNVPDYVANLPVEQFNHIVNTLKGAPAEVQGAAQDALNEIRGHYANRVNSIGNSTNGTWNAKAVSQFLKDNTQNMSQVFSPDELKDYGILDSAGDLLKNGKGFSGTLQPSKAAKIATKAITPIMTIGAHVLAPGAGELAGYATGTAVEHATESLLKNSAASRIKSLTRSTPADDLNHIAAQGAPVGLKTVRDYASAHNMSTDVALAKFAKKGIKVK